jgi:hypothetical protein
MKLTKLELIPDLPEGTQLQAVEGKITAVYDYNQGQHPEHGPWSMQNATLEWGGQKVKLNLKNRPDAKQFKGKHVIIEALHNQDKNKWSGIATEDNDYNGTVTRRLKITASAQMYDADSGGEAPRSEPARQQSTPQRQAQSERPATQQRQQPTTQRQTPPADDVMKVKRKIAQITTLYGYCYDAAVAAAHRIHSRHGYVVVPATVGIMADKFMMETIRRIELDFLPLSDPSALKGKPLSALIPFLEEAIDKGVARRTQVEEQAKNPPQRKAQADMPTAPPPTDDFGEGSIQDGMEDDDIPF